jgi:aldose 1-epimerase
MKVGIITYGGIIVTLETPDKNGTIDDITLGFDSLDGYLQDHPYFGAIVGRYGNRIAKARFTLDGKEYSLAVNNGPNALHGGLQGFDKKVWKAETITQDGIPALKLYYLSKDGEEGYPGNLKTTVIYSLNNENELKIEYFAETDKATPLNLTNHAYFNLAGHRQLQSIANHVLTLHADRFTPVDESLIPTGELRNVKGTPMDFTEPKKIGERIDADDEQIRFGGGYDHNFVLNKKGASLTLGGRVHEPTSGRVLEFFTTQPGVQFYTGNFLDGTLKGKGGKVYEHRFGFCLETQHFPDSPNQPNFPTTILKPDETYHHSTVYKFFTEKE